MKQLSIFGSTGSIGRNALKIVEMFPDRFRVRAIAAKSDIRLLSEQIDRFLPDIAVIFDESLADDLKKRVSVHRSVKILSGSDGMTEAAGYEPADTVVMAVVGAAGLMPTIAAIEAGKTVALATKETLVMAGDYVMNLAARRGVPILPIDSEHSAIFQCIAGQRAADIDKILLTASGGPFFNKPETDFETITPEHALKHPTWQMGKKISIDSATMMNKGLEVIEASHLFGIPADRIEIVIHPQSIVHSMVSFKDGAVIGQMGVPDMKGAIAYALSFPERLCLRQPAPDFPKIGSLTFFEPDTRRFPCLSLAYLAGKTGGTLPAVMNAANEIAVEAFLDGKIRFADIPRIIRNAMETHTVVQQPDIHHLLQADRQVRNQKDRLTASVSA